VPFSSFRSSISNPSVTSRKSRQVGQHGNVDVVVSECRGVALQAILRQPFRNRLHCRNHPWIAGPSKLDPAPSYWVKPLCGKCSGMTTNAMTGYHGRQRRIINVFTLIANHPGCPMAVQCRKHENRPCHCHALGTRPATRRTLRGAAIQIAAAGIAVSSDHMARACAEKLVQAATP
jgi:hypothetical protein